MRHRLLDYVIGALSGLALAAFYIGTVPALIAAAVLILAVVVLVVVRAVRAVQINRIFRDELGDDPFRGQHGNHTNTGDNE
jgi:hypothetical protein